MKNRAPYPDPEQILKGLKDFQRNTVEYVFRRLYLDKDASDRFLIADEVGLGKTLVARGLIAKAIDYLSLRVDRIDIIYVCSNADIARQNIQRLNITGKKDFSLASRITLLPLELNNLNQNRINFVSFTPGTSFDLKSGTGIEKERALLYWLLYEEWFFRGKASPLNILQGRSRADRFREYINRFRDIFPIDATLAQVFIEKLRHKIQYEEQQGQPDLFTRFTELCEPFSHHTNNISWEDNQKRNQLIGDLRLLLAKACVSALEPDLIILDEFQRFKHLLEPENELNKIAQELFNFSNTHSSTKVVLLSATPYKMYTLAHEAAEENHYEDFLRTIQFLQSNQNQTDYLRKLLEQYRRELFRLGQNNYDNLLELKSGLESELRRVMVRTERLAASPERNGMLVEIPCSNIKLEPQDLETYLSLQTIARILGHSDTLEYWKSAPYLLNFMDDYELKRSFIQALDDRDQETSLAHAIATSSALLLSRQDIETYAKVDACNARLRGLLEDTIGVGAWKLLWVPPSLPYYKLGGVFSNAKLTQVTKRLVFSSWRIVPKMIASLLSYEAERKMIKSFEQNPQNTPEARERRRPLLRFARSKDNKIRLTGMPVLGLLYPSMVLAIEGDPLSFAIKTDAPGIPALEEVQSRIANRIEALLQALNIEPFEAGAEDESWYWVAPILLDRHFEPQATHDWFSLPDLASTWAGKEHEQEADEPDPSLWAEHIKMAKAVVDAPFLSLGKPPKDLSLVLAHMAIGAPGIVALRTLSRITANPTLLTNSAVRNYAAQTAWSFRTLFNSPEATALIRGLNPKASYWRSVLNYCVNGCLQAVLDEYAHILQESLGLLNQQGEEAEKKNAEETAKEISEAISTALTLRTSVMEVDEIVGDTRGRSTVLMAVSG
uniref:DEAD-like helicase n=1 Tax=Cyanothece sp. (strain PCC 7425 / ATCC 29141) TaxID=395961 RepID=B8HZJ6_CYAP4